MGISLQETYTTPQGVPLPNVYISFCTNPVYIIPQTVANVKTFTIQCTANMFVDQARRDENMQHFENRVVTVRNLESADLPYANLYTDLKTTFPNSVDC